MVGSIAGLHADEKKAWQDEHFKRLAGRWTTVREEKTDQGKIKQTRVALEFVGVGVNVSIFKDEKTEKPWYGYLKITSIDREGTRLSSSTLKLDKGTLFCDFVGEKLILVGGISQRPYEGFMFSGEYQRAKSAAQEKGDAEARSAVKAGKLKLKEFPPKPYPPGHEFFVQLLREKCQVAYEVMQLPAGMKSAAFAEEISAWNAVMQAEIQSKFGADILDQLHKEALNRWQEKLNSGKNGPAK
jgi:hypothetical protein